MKVRVKTCHTMNLIERRLRARGQRLQFRPGQKAVAKLDGAQVVKDHGAVSREKSAMRKNTAPHGAGFQGLLYKPCDKQSFRVCFTNPAINKVSGFVLQTLR